MSTALPIPSRIDSAEGTKLFFDAYGKEPLEFPATDITAAIGFFESKGFSDLAATSTATVILKQAKLDRVPVFQLLDTLKDFNGLQLSALVTEVLNNNRSPRSILGYKFVDVEKDNQVRNIIP